MGEVLEARRLAVLRLSVFNAMQRRPMGIVDCVRMLRFAWKPAWAAAEDVVTEASVGESCEWLVGKGWLKKCDNNTYTPVTNDMLIYTTEDWCDLKRQR